MGRCALTRNSFEESCLVILSLDEIALLYSFLFITKRPLLFKKTQEIFYKNIIYFKSLFITLSQNTFKHIF